MEKRREIRNSTAEFLIFQIEGKEQGIEVYYKDKTVWCTQKAMGMLFDCSSDNVGLHLKNIFASGELVKDSVTEKISATASDGKNYMTQFYNLDAIISVGYRVNSIRATQFRQWATRLLPSHPSPPFCSRQSSGSGLRGCCLPVASNHPHDRVCHYY